ncbi:MAG: hypothetical protein DRH50_16830 [Deltaproteobacteria bacterium]|nr:MAG: hypothetical protein DRH50_16830 [Deltaproteobacteria bacterium]
MTKSEKFVAHMVDRCQVDGRLAALMGPLNKGYGLMVEAYAEMQGLDVEKFERQYAKTLKTCREWQRT